MSGAKEVRSKISSVKNTQKITGAMELVAASKMRKAQERMAASKPYATRIRKVVSHITAASSEYRPDYLVQRETKRVGFILISTDRGLCGGLNINLFKAAINSIKEWKDQSVDVDLCIVGNKAASFFRAVGGNIISATGGLGEKPLMNDLIGAVQVMLSAYTEGKIDRLFLVNNEFVNTMTQRPTVRQLLPLVPEEILEEESGKLSWDYIYEPDAKQLLDEFLKRFIESQVYQAVVENNACEQAARMVAMKAATDNAGNLIDELELVYNKARQAAITQELSEIVSGAAAV